jgi:hypothetical protein
VVQVELRKEVQKVKYAKKGGKWVIKNRKALIRENNQPTIAK